jgi:excisionase family DNA binding protein
MPAKALHQPSGRDAFSVAEVCARTGIGRDTIYDAIRTGKLAARKIGRRMIITERALHRFLESLPMAGKAV